MSSTSCLRLWISSLLLILSVFLSSAQATNAINLAPSLDIGFYLPLDNEADPNLINGLQKLFDQNGLSRLKVNQQSSWLDFQNGLRTGRFGVYLAPPHFASWAINQHQFKPLVRIGAALSYVIAVRRDDAEIFEMNDLANRRVCSSKPLNLDYLIINNAFDNTVLSADIKVVPDVFTELRRASSRCRGFAINSWQLTRIAHEFPDRHIRLQQGERFNNLAVVAHPMISPTLLDKLTRLLLRGRAKKTLAPVLSEFAEDTTLVRAQKADYPPAYQSQLLPFWQLR